MTVMDGRSGLATSAIDGEVAFSSAPVEEKVAIIEYLQD